jgi:hypothetical protein
MNPGCPPESRVRASWSIDPNRTTLSHSGPTSPRRTFTGAECASDTGSSIYPDRERHLCAAVGNVLSIIRRAKIPIAHDIAAQTSRGFLPRRLSDDGPRCKPHHLVGAIIRNASQKGKSIHPVTNVRPAIKSSHIWDSTTNPGRVWLVLHGSSKFEALGLRSQLSFLIVSRHCGQVPVHAWKSVKDFAELMLSLRDAEKKIEFQSKIIEANNATLAA